MAKLTSLILAAAAAAVSARFADQGAGERIRRHVGPVRSAFSTGGRSALVVTAANALASLNVRSGEPAWRKTLDGELLQASSLQASFAITMSSTEKSTLVRRWAAEGGSMSWERALSAAHVYDVSSSEDITVVTIDGVASVFEARTGRSLDSTLAGKRVVALAGNAGASKLFAATLADSGAASIYSLKAIDGALTVREVATAAVGSAASFVLVASGPDAATLLATSEDGKSLHVVCAGTDAVAYTIASLRVSAGASGSSGVTVTSIAAVPDASASGGSAVTFVRLSLSDASQLVIAVGATSEGGAGAKAVVSVSASGEVSSEGSAKLPATCASLVVIRYDASPAVVYTAASAGGITHLLRVASDATGGVSATLTALGSVSANGDVTVAGSIGGGAVEAATLKPTLTLPGPLPASDLPSAAGTVAAAFALPFTKQGEAKASLRLLLTLSSGSVVALAPGGAQSPAGKVAWSSPEGDACVTQVLSVDVPKAGYGSDEASAGSSSTSRDPALSLPSRIVSQLAALQAAAPALLASVADRVSRATGRGASGPAGVAAGNKGIIAPGVQIGGLEKVLVFRTRVDGGEAGACAALGATATTATGVLKAVDFESGAQRWALLLPLAPALAALAPAGVKTTVVLSRPRPIQALAAELLVIESHGSTTALTWVNAHTGAVTGSAAYASTASLARVIRTPLLHTGSHREVFALLHADGSAVAAPGGADVGAALIAIKSEFVSVDLQTDEGTGAESVVGVILSPAAAGAAPTARGPQGGAPAVPLMSLTSSALWSVRVSGGAATGERVLAMTASGHSAASGAGSGTSPSSGGVLSTELLSSARTGSGGAAKAERLIQEALAAASGEEAGGSRPVQILGDDSLMLKYVNPHLIAVLVGPAGPVAGAWERRHPRNASAPAPAAASGGQPGLTLTLIDGVTSRVVHTRRHAGASGPCALLRHDNWVIYSYWNARSRRPEVASAALFEGAIDTYELTPWRKPAGWTGSSGDVSAYGQELPVVAHRSFILPVTVSDIAVTRTRYGITTPHLLLTTTQGGLLSIDRRLLDPRRPSEPPSKSQQAEGLVQYSPVLPMRHNWLLTGGESVPGARLTHSAPSVFESTTLIAFLGLDHFFVRTAPAKTFDQLDPDFSSGLFVAVVAAGALGALYMRRLVKRKELLRAWK